MNLKSVRKNAEAIFCLFKLIYKVSNNNTKYFVFIIILNSNLESQQCYKKIMISKILYIIQGGNVFRKFFPGFLNFFQFFKFLPGYSDFLPGF